MNNTSPRVVVGNGIDISMYRAKINARLDELCLLQRVEELLGGCTFSKRPGRFGYKYTADIHGKHEAALGKVYWGHKHPSATPCVEFNSTTFGLTDLSIIREHLPHSVTAVSISHSISYIPFATLQQITSKAIDHPQGSVRRRVEIRKESDGVSVSLERDICKVELATGTAGSTKSILTISVNPASEFRALLTEYPIRGAWSCSYWTRELFDLIFRQGDPLPPQYADLFSETLRLSSGGRVHM